MYFSVHQKPQLFLVKYNNTATVASMRVHKVELKINATVSLTDINRRRTGQWLQNKYLPLNLQAVLLLRSLIILIII